jgi:hypothetical protein
VHASYSVVPFGWGRIDRPLGKRRSRVGELSCAACNQRARRPLEMVESKVQFTRLLPWSTLL